MATETGSATRLEQLRERIERWRRTRTKHGPMPEPLWSEAVALARWLGVCPVSRALGVGYESLQQRLRQADTQRPAPAAAERVRFVELSGAQVASPVAGSVVELQSAGGARLTIRLSPGSVLDVAALVAAFRGHA